MTEVFKSGVISEEHFLEFVIDNINGEINYIMFHVNNPVAARVDVVNHEHIILLETRSLMGKQYLPVRIRPVDFQMQGYTQGAFVKYKINGSVRIQVEGIEGTQVDFWIDFTRKRA